MTTEEKQLLLIDLCARLPYSTIVNVYNGKYREDVKLEPYIVADIDEWQPKPYLRPISDMTEEEETELDEIDTESSRIFFDDLFKRIKKDGKENCKGFLPDYPTLDWLNAHHF